MTALSVEQSRTAITCLDFKGRYTVFGPEAKGVNSNKYSQLSDQLGRLSVDGEEAGGIGLSRSQKRTVKKAAGFLLSHPNMLVRDLASEDLELQVSLEPRGEPRERTLDETREYARERAEQIYSETELLWAHLDGGVLAMEAKQQFSLQEIIGKVISRR